MGDRLASGLHTGTVGAAFGGLGGPIGLAAGGGTGFLAGFVAGRPLFGGSGADDRDSWERQIEAQQRWEDQVAGRVQALDGGLPPPAAGIPTDGSTAAAGAGAYPPPTGSGYGLSLAGGGPVALTSADPVHDHEAWSAQILAHAQPAATGSGLADATPSGASAGGAGEPAAAGGEAPDALAPPSPEEREIRALDVDDDGRPDAWFEYEGGVLQTHAMDRNGDGRRDREDFYEGGVVTERRLDEDWDGRFERRDTIREGEVTARMIDRDGDGRYEVLSLIGSGGATGAGAAGASAPGEAP
jgi:hypothetical protein